MSLSGPLSGVTVVDLTRVLAGPFCTMILSDLGARVIKVERPETGDDARAFGPFIGDRSAYFASLNRGKQSIALDLRADGDRAIFESLLETADVVVENFRAGSMERLGYGWETLHPRFPRLIYAAASGFGHTGPYANRPAYDMVVQAMGGIMSLTGQPGGAPTRVGSSIGDITAGLFTAIGISSALYHRALHDEGMKIDVAMLDSQVAILENAIARYQATGSVPGPIGSRHPSISPFGAFRTQDGHVVVAAGNDLLFAKLARALDCEAWLARDEFANNEARTLNVETLTRELEGVLGAHPTAHWLAILEAAEVPCGPINDIAEVLKDPQVLARQMVVEVADGESSPLRVAGNPIKLSAFPDAALREPAPELDQHRDAILSALDPRTHPPAPTRVPPKPDRR